MPQIRKKQVLWREKKGTVTALILDSGEFLEFNAVGSTIWKSLNEGKDMESIIDILAKTYDAKREKLAQDTETFIARMKSAGLLED